MDAAKLPAARATALAALNAWVQYMQLGFFMSEVQTIDSDRESEQGHVRVNIQGRTDRGVTVACVGATACFKERRDPDYPFPIEAVYLAPMIRQPGGQLEMFGKFACRFVDGIRIEKVPAFPGDPEDLIFYVDTPARTFFYSTVHGQRQVPDNFVPVSIPLPQNGPTREEVIRLQLNGCKRIPNPDKRYEPAWL